MIHFLAILLLTFSLSVGVHLTRCSTPALRQYEQMDTRKRCDKTTIGRVFGSSHSRSQCPFKSLGRSSCRFFSPSRPRPLPSRPGLPPRPPPDPITILVTKSGRPRPNSTNSFGARVACPPASVVRRSYVPVIVRFR